MRDLYTLNTNLDVVEVEFLSSEVNEKQKHSYIKYIAGAPLTIVLYQIVKFGAYVKSCFFFFLLGR